MSVGVYESLGKLFREKREARGLTQATIADLIGLSRPAYVNIEAGRQRLLFHQATVLCSIYDIDMNQFKERGKLRVTWEKAGAA